MDFFTLPNELVHDIAKYLPTADLNCLVQASRWLECVLTPLLYDRTALPRKTRLCYGTRVRRKGFGTPAEASHLEQVLCWASEKGYERPIHHLLHRGAPLISEFYKHGETPFHLAAQHGHTGVIKIFLHHWVETCAEILSETDHYAVHNIAAQRGYKDIISLLIPHIDKAQKLSALSLAAWSGHVSTVSVIIPYIADSEQDRLPKGTHLLPALENSASHGHVDVVAVLLPHIQGTELGESLQKAAKNGQDSVVQILLSHIDIRLRSAEATAAAPYAVAGGNAAVVDILLDAKCDPNVVINRQEQLRLLHWVCQFASSKSLLRDQSLDKTAAVLLENGADANALDRYGRTPLHIAVVNGPDTTRKSLRSSPWLSEQDPGRSTSVVRVHQSLLGLLASAGADMNARDHFGRTPLHEAAKCCDKRTVKALLELGADDTVKDNSSKTALRPVKGENDAATVLRHHKRPSKKVQPRKKGPRLQDPQPVVVDPPVTPSGSSQVTPDLSGRRGIPDLTLSDALREVRKDESRRK